MRPAAGSTTGQEPRRRNVRGHGSRLRTDILTAAARLLDETGDEHAVTLRAVARRVGITAPAIYAHFPDRQAILLAVVRDAFADLTGCLEEVAAATGSPDPADTAAQLRALCDTYLHFAARHPQRYRVMFGGLWDAGQAMAEDSLTAEDAAALGQDALAVLTTALDACVRSGASTSTDTGADAVTLWLGLHGLAHQRAVSTAFPWPADVTGRLVTSLAHLAA